MKQILCVLIIDKQFVLLHAANRKEGDGGERPITGEEEALPKAVPSGEGVWPGPGSQPCLGKTAIKTI